MNTRTRSVTVINVFAPKPEALDDFLAVQIAAPPGRYELVYQVGDV